MIEFVYTSDFLKDIEWLRKHDRRLFKKVRDLVADVSEHPESGKGKPERLKYYAELVVFSRRVDKKNRLTYEIVDSEHVKMLGCRSHYGDR